MLRNIKHKAVFASVVLTAISGACAGNAEDASPLAKDVAKVASVSTARAEYIIRHARAALAEEGNETVTLPMLLAVGVRESNLRQDIESCKVLGDGGEAFGLFQEHARGKRRKTLCKGGAREQAKEAIRHLVACGDDPVKRLACYTGRKTTHRFVKDRMALAARFEAVLAQ